MLGNKGKYQSWVARQKGNPLLLFVAAGSLSVSFLVLYRSYYKPWERRLKKMEAEKYAQTLYEYESR